MNRKKAERLFEAMTELDDRFVMEAAPGEKPALKSAPRWKPLISAAACFALVALAGVTFINSDLAAGLAGGGSSAPAASSQAAAQEAPLAPGAIVGGEEAAPAPSVGSDKKEEEPVLYCNGLPMLNAAEEEDGAFGFEGYMVYEESDLVSANPWNLSNAAEITALPVFSNIALGAEPAWDEMESVLTDAAGRLYPGMKLDISDNGLSEEERQKFIEKHQMAGVEPDWSTVEPYALEARVENSSFRMENDMTLTIENQPAEPLPEGCTWGYYAAYEETEKAGTYVAEAYADLLDMEQPTLAVEGGDRNIYGRQSYRVKVYEGTGSLTEQILAYNFTYATFDCNEEGELWLTRLRSPDLSAKLGDYPILTPEEAERALLAGHYVTNAPEPFAGEEALHGVELVYKTGRYRANWIPYYRFYAEVPGWEYTPEGTTREMASYGAYYVPAIRPEYILDMELWNGSFNE
ncbi:MAG: hypothetical protein IIV90_05895 [Oscillospiraceae bacterium]|nr:hypothetical protein [Oscillospiraceae bacterium]